MSNPLPTSNPRVRCHANGYVTITGLEYYDARSLFNAAGEHIDELIRDAALTRPANADEDRAWRREMNRVIDKLLAGLSGDPKEKGRRAKLRKLLESAEGMLAVRGVAEPEA